MSIVRRQRAASNVSGLLDAADLIDEDEFSHEDGGSSSVAMLHGGFFVSEREALIAKQTFWCVMAAHAARAEVFRLASIAMAAQKMKAVEAEVRRHRLNTEHMTALAALDTMKRKHERCRSIIRQYVQRRMQEKHHRAVDLLLRALRHRFRIAETIRQVKWFRRSVIICQRQARVFLQSIAARRLLLHLQWIRKECELLQCPNLALENLHQAWSDQQRQYDNQRILLAAAAYSGPVTSAPGGTRAVGGKQGKSAAATAGAVKGGDGDWPIRKPGSPAFFVWSTKITFAPQNGIPIDVRSLEVNAAVQTLVKTFVQALRSTDANRKFFVKQKARYETEGFGELGLPRPKLPSPPIFYLFVGAAALHMKVRVTLKEKNGNQAGGSMLGVVKSVAAALKHQPSFAPKPPSALKPVGALSDQAEPATSMDNRSSVALVSSNRGSTLPVQQGARSIPRSASFPNIPRVPSSGSPSPTHAERKQSNNKPLPLARSGKPLSSASSKSDVKSSAVPPETAVGAATPQVASPSSPSDIDGKSPSSQHRRSVFDHFESVGSNDTLPCNVRTDEEYAKLILGKSNVKALRDFLTTSNTLHLTRVDSIGGSGGAAPGTFRHRKVAAVVPAPGAVRGDDAEDNAAQSVQLPMQLQAIQGLYESEARRAHADTYHLKPDNQHIATQPLPPSNIAKKPMVPPATDGALSARRVRVIPTAVAEPLSARRPSPIDPSIKAHRPPVAGAISRRQHEQRMQGGFDRAVRSFHDLEKPVELGHDAQHDITKLLAFGGSTDVQRRLMVLGGQRHATAANRAGPATAVTSSRQQLNDDPQLHVVNILTGLDDARSQQWNRLRSLKTM